MPQSNEHYLQFKVLPPLVGPVHVVRHDGCTVVLVDPRCRKVDATMGCLDLLTDEEVLVYRTAFGGPPRGEMCPPQWVSEDPVCLEVPAALYLPPSPPAFAQDALLESAWGYEAWL